MAPARSKASLPEQNGTLQHITHPHVLIKQTFEDIQNEGYENDEFVCDGCSVEGSGARFHCKQCSFDLHEDCANCPGFLTSPIHPNHPLELIWEGAQNDHGKLRPCDVCGDQVKGLFYRCSSGASENRYDEEHYFFMHPTCSKFQPQLHHAIDENPPFIPDGNIHPQCETLAYNNYQQVRPSHFSQPQEARSSQRQVANAETDADALMPAKYAAKKAAKYAGKMAIKAGKYILSQRQVADAETDSNTLEASKDAAMTAEAGRYLEQEPRPAQQHVSDATAAELRRLQDAEEYEQLVANTMIISKMRARQRKFCLELI